MSERSNPPRRSSSASAILARSSAVEALPKPATARTGDFAGSPMTLVICSGVRAIRTKRRPSLPIASNATTLLGPAVTCGFVGASG